jgi:hypothetical protein
MPKFVHIALGMLVSLGMLFGLAACQMGQQACNVSVAQIAVVRGINYLPGNTVLGYGMAGTALTEANLGPVYDTINTSEGGCSPAPSQGNYSTYLAAGTQLYTVKGYQPSFRLAVKQAVSNSQQSITLLEAISNPHASKGGALMQLDQKVDSILLYPESSSSSSPATPPLKTVSSPQQVAKLIALFDQAPVRAIAATGGTSDRLVFHFSDGTLSSLVYEPATGWTNRNVILPATFASLLTGAGNK